MTEKLQEKLDKLSLVVDGEKDLEFIKQIISEESNGLPVDEEVYSLMLNFCYTKTRDLLMDTKSMADYSEDNRIKMQHFFMSQRGKSRKPSAECDANIFINRTKPAVNRKPIVTPFMENDLFLPSWRKCQVGPKPVLMSMDTPASDDEIDPSGLLKIFPEGYKGEGDDDDDDEFGLNKASLMGIPDELDAILDIGNNSDSQVDKAKKISGDMPTSPKRPKLESPNKGKVNSPPPMDSPPAPTLDPASAPAPAPSHPPATAPRSRAAALAAANRTRLSAATASALEMALAPTRKRAKIKVDDEPKAKQNASKSGKSKTSPSPNSKKNKSKESGSNAGDEKSMKSKSTKNDKPNEAKKTGLTALKEKSTPVTPAKPKRKATPSKLTDANPDAVKIPSSASSSGVNSNLPKINIIQNFKRDLNAKRRRR